MIEQNSYTLQNMMTGIRPGNGNIGAGLGYPAQPFQPPYPSPMQMAQMNNPYASLSVPPITKMENGVPVQYEYQPEYASGPIIPPAPTVSYVQAPGLPTNPDLAGTPARSVSPQPNQGRYFNVQPAVTGYTEQLKQATQNNVNYGTNIYNPYNPYIGGYHPPVQPQVVNQSPIGRVDYYNGQPVHPHIHSGWYGCPEYPFVKTTGIDPIQSNPAYQNPWLREQEEKRAQLIREMQDRANIAAYYGMTYNEWVDNTSRTYQTLSRICSRYFGLSEEETEKRAAHWKPKTLDEMVKGDFDFPPGAFGPDGKFTDEYLDEYCINHEMLDRVHKTLKVEIVKTNEKGEVVERIPCKPAKKRPSWLRTKKMLDNIERTQQIIERNQAYKRYVMQWMYDNAPERALDKTNYGPFEVVGKLMQATHKSDMEDLLRKQKIEMKANRAYSNLNPYFFTTANGPNSLKFFFDQAKKVRQERTDREFNEEIRKIIPDEKMPQIMEELKQRAKDGPPYVLDGDWVIAKPGVDIVGVPLNESVNKIIRMNSVTGEEEIYNPDKLSQEYLRVQVMLSTMTPNFRDVNDDGEKRRDSFNESSWASNR